MPPENELADVPVVDHISDSKALQLAAKTFINFGCLVIKSVFENNFIEQAYAEYMKEHRDHFLEGGLNNDLYVGDRRIMIPLHLKGVFNSPDFYANPRVYPLMNFLLGNDVILNSLGSVVSLPGAKEQHIHIDYPNIYTALETYNSDMSWIGKAPPYAVTMGIPLIPMNPETGCTRFWPGSHLDPHSSLDNPIDLYADAGSCVLFGVFSSLLSRPCTSGRRWRYFSSVSSSKASFAAISACARKVSRTRAARVSAAFDAAHQCGGAGPACAEGGLERLPSWS